MSDRFVVAFDVGTSGVKAVLADLACRVVASCYEPYGLRAADGGWVEQDVEEIYSRLAAACRALLDRPGVTPEQVEAVSVTAQMFNVVPVGASGEPLAPMLSWLDTRATPQAAALAEAMGPGEQFRRLGATITAKDILPRILWLREHALRPRGRGRRGRAGVTVAVLGLGPIGLGLVAACAARGARVLGVGRRRVERLRLARAFGAEAAVFDLGQLAALTEGVGPDVVVEAVGQPQAWSQAVAGPTRSPSCSPTAIPLSGWPGPWPGRSASPTPTIACSRRSSARDRPRGGSLTWPP